MAERLQHPIQDHHYMYCMSACGPQIYNVGPWLLLILTGLYKSRVTNDVQIESIIHRRFEETVGFHPLPHFRLTIPQELYQINAL